MTTSNEYDILRIIHDAPEWASARYITEQFYRVYSDKGAQNINSRLVGLTNKGYLETHKEPVGFDGRNVTVWTLTDAGVRALVDYEKDKGINRKEEDVTGSAEDVTGSAEDVTRKEEEDIAGDPTAAAMEETSADTIVDEVHEAIDAAGKAVSVVVKSSDPAAGDDKPKLHQETIEYLDAVKEQLQKAEKDLFEGRFSEAVSELRKVVLKLDIEDIMDVIHNMPDCFSKETASLLIVASDLIRGSS